MSKGPVYIVEDEAEICEDVRTLLESNGYKVHSYSSGEDFLDGWDGSLVGCLLLDMRMAGMSGLEVLNRISDATKVLPVLLFTSLLDMHLAVQATKNGVHDYCPKPFSPDVILAKVHDALVVNESRLKDQAKNIQTLQALTSLTVREREILDLLCDGLSSKQIGEALGISSFTVDNHRARIMSKLGVNSVSQVVQMTLNARR